MLVIPISIKKKSTQELVQKLPEDLKLTILAYNNLLRKKGIIPLLNSNEENFESYFQVTTQYLSSYMISIGDIIIRKQKDYPNLLNDLAEYNSIILEEIGEEIADLSDEETRDTILYSLEIFEQFLMMTTNPKFESYLNQTEYVPAVNSMVYILVCLSVYLYSFKQDQENKNIMSMLNKKLCMHTKELEAYVETAEIEFDSEQMNIFEKTKTFK